MDDGETGDVRFETLLRRVLDGIATPAERAAFCERLRGRPDRMATYAELLELLAVAKCLGGNLVQGGGERSASGPTGRRERSPGQDACFTFRLWLKAAAAVVVLGGAAVLLGLFWERTPAVGAGGGSSEHLSDGGLLKVSPVCLLRSAGASGLMLPGALPGKVRLAGGFAAVRLPSGVELSLLGPLEMEVESGMGVRLSKGRLVAWVPPRASGFTVRAPGLTAWDIGTIFSVSAESGGSGLFVFKGSVQVTDDLGDGVGLCEAGEGARAEANGNVVKISADWPEARALFTPVRGRRAAEAPETALATAGQITDLWRARYVPEEASRVREAARREAEARNAPRRIPFQKTAWVRPAVSVSEKEEDMDKSKTLSAVAAALVTMGAGPAGATSVPVLIDTTPSDNRFWTTVFTNEVPLQWDWATDAVRAELVISGMNSRHGTNFTTSVSNCLWRVFEAGETPPEDVYDLQMTFYRSGDAVAGVLTSRLAVVAGAFGGTRVDSDPVPDNKEWVRLNENVVIPYDAGWAEATAGRSTSQLVITKATGAAQTNAFSDAAGFFGWALRNGGWGYGDFRLALTFPGAEGEWDATLTRLPGGTMLSVK